MFTAINCWRVTGKVKGQIYNVKRVLIDIFYFLMSIILNQHKIANHFKNNREKFDEDLKKWTKLYASN